MGTVLGLVAVHGDASLTTFDTHALQDADVARFREITAMELDTRIDAAYPARWIGEVWITLTDGTPIVSRVETPRGDPGNPLSQEEIIAKAQSLSGYGGAEAPDTVNRWIDAILTLDQHTDGAAAFRR
jgi:2-methylcitrate dehydratase PrpD